MARMRLAAESDAESVQAMYAPYVRETVISFELQPPSVDEMAGRIGKLLSTHPWLVCADDGGAVAGYAYASKHRERAAYQWSVDVAVYVRPDCHRTGVGRGLYTALLAVLGAQGFYNAYAGIALPNDASVGLHRALGFEAVGVYRQVGYKLGRWHDVSWWGLALQPHSDESPQPPRPLSDVIDSPAWAAALDAGLALIRL